MHAPGYKQTKECAQVHHTANQACKFISFGSFGSAVADRCLPRGVCRLSCCEMSFSGAATKRRCGGSCTRCVGHGLGLFAWQAGSPRS
jgi:hypothetical protein